MLSSLPIEVIENVIDQAADVTETLRSFALTCRDLRPRSRYHLFRFIRFQDMSQLNSFREVLNLDPDVASLVVSLTMSTAQGNPKSLSLPQLVPTDLFCKLPNMRIWTIADPTASERRSCRWLSFAPLTLACLGRYGAAIVELHLESVYLPNYAQFMQYILAFRGLKVLHCRSVYLKTGNLGDSPLYWIKQRLAKESQLSTLITGHDISDDVVVILLEYFAPTLLDLELHLHKPTSINVPASISELRRLNSLTLVLDAEGFKRGGNNGVREELVLRIFRIIEALSLCPEPRLRNLTIRLVHCTSIIPFLDLVFNPGVYPALKCYGELETVLLSLPSLCNIEVDHDAPRDIDLTFLIKEYLPALARRISVTSKRSTPTRNRQSDHDKPIQTVVVSPDSKRIASGSEDSTIILWDTQHQSRIVYEWIAHSGTVYSLAFSPDSRRLASAGRDRKVVVWSFNGSRVEQTAILEGHSDEVYTCTWSPDGTLLASGSKDGTVRVWDAGTYQQLHSVQSPAVKSVWSVHFSPDGRWIASGGVSTSCAVWDAATGDLHMVLSDRLARAVLDFASGCIATVSYDHTIRIWDVETGEALVSLPGDTQWVGDVVFSTDGRRVVSWSGDKTVKVCDSVSSDLLLSLEAHTGDVGASLSLDGQSIPTSWDSTWRASHSPWFKPSIERGRLWCSRDGEILTSVGLGSTSAPGKVCIRHPCGIIPELEYSEADKLRGSSAEAYVVIVVDVPRMLFEQERHCAFLRCDDIPMIPIYVGQRPQPVATHVVHFRDLNGRNPFLSDRLDDIELVGGEDPALPEDISAKIVMRLRFEGCEPYTRQIMGRRSTKDASPISLRVLARKIVKEMKFFVRRAHDTGKPLRYRGREVMMDQLMLARFVRASVESWYPIFRIVYWA